MLRARTIHTSKEQDWAGYKPVARTYLEKYGANDKPEEKQMFQRAIEEH